MTSAPHLDAEVGGDGITSGIASIEICEVD